MKQPEITYFLTLAEKTAFFKLNDIFLECSLYREASPNIPPLICLRENSCTVGRNCMESLVPRIHKLFDILDRNIKLILLYYRYPNSERLGAGVFWKDLTEPRSIILNPHGWRLIKSRSEIFKFIPEKDFYF